VIGAGLAATALGQEAFSIPAFAPERLAKLFLNALLLQLAIFAVTLAASAFGREAGRVALIGVLVAVVSFLVHTVATLWSKAAVAKPYSLHAYFEPREVLTQGNLPVASVGVLAAVAVVFTVVAFVRFARRDLP